MMICVVIVVALVQILLLYVGLLLWRKVNRMITHTNWWRNRYVGIQQFELMKGNERLFDIVNLGSNPARFAFFYEDVIGQSWATGSQGQDMDFELLKYFHSYLKRGGTVLIPIMPFTAISPYIATRKDYWGPAYYSKFYQLLDWDQKRHLPYADEISKYLSSPLSFDKRAWRHIFWDNPRDTRYEISEQPMMAAELEQDATKWMEGWFTEFNIKSLDDVLLPRWNQYYDAAVALNKQIVNYCRERGYKPVFICVPMTRYLSNKFSASARKYLVTDFVEKCNEHDIPFLDYTLDDRFASPDLYFNSFFLNMRGRKLFTRQVLKDLGVAD